MLESGTGAAAGNGELVGMAGAGSGCVTVPGVIGVDEAGKFGSINSYASLYCDRVPRACLSSCWARRKVQASQPVMASGISPATHLKPAY